jgi:hypothetical protein
MRASTSNYSQSSKKNNWVVLSYDGYSSYLLVIDKASCYIWVFLTTSKEPPLDIINAFLGHFGHEHSGLICTDQGGELARLFALTDTVLRTHRYAMESTGADSLLQNGAVKIYNDKLAIQTRTLIYGAGLPAKFWLAALLHSVYLHNRLVHTVVKKTSYKGYFGFKPDIGHLKPFGSCVCVKCSGNCWSKLDKHDFKLFFWGIQQLITISYIWIWTPASSNGHTMPNLMKHGTCRRHAHLPVNSSTTWVLHLTSLCIQRMASLLRPRIRIFTFREQLNKYTFHGLPWQHCLHRRNYGAYPIGAQSFPSYSGPDTRITITAKAARAQSSPGQPCQPRRPRAVDFMTEYDIGRNNIAMVYISPDPYFDVFEQPLDIRNFDLNKHATAGLSLYEKSGRLYLASMSPSTPAANFPDWRTRVRGAWLIKIGSATVTSIEEAHAAFTAIQDSGATSTALLFAHPEI